MPIRVGPKLQAGNIGNLKCRKYPMHKKLFDINIGNMQYLHNTSKFTQRYSYLLQCTTKVRKQKFCFLEMKMENMEIGFRCCVIILNRHLGIYAYFLVFHDVFIWMVLWVLFVFL